MHTLIIKDLARTEALGRDAMALVRGGYNMGAQYCAPWTTLPSFCMPGPTDASIHANQDLTQMQQVVNATANDSAFLSGVDVTNKTKQFGQNNISVG